MSYGYLGSGVLFARGGYLVDIRCLSEPSGTFGIRKVVIYTIECLKNYRLDMEL